MAIRVGAFNGANQVTFVGAGGVGTVIKTLPGPATLASITLTAVGQFTEIKLTPSNGFNLLVIESLQVAAVNCFCADTHIATPCGERWVQDLRTGDRVLTASGAQTTVKWLGRQDISTKMAHPAKVNPVCISAGALADGVPSRDLWVSGDHAVAVDGLLINASALINGSSIHWVRAMPVGGFAYFHIDTGAHELVMAEGCAAETYLDLGDLGTFSNAHTRAVDPVVAEMALMRISAARLVPKSITARLVQRAERIRERIAA